MIYRIKRPYVWDKEAINRVTTLIKEDIDKFFKLHPLNQEFDATTWLEKYLAFQLPANDLLASRAYGWKYLYLNSILKSYDDFDEAIVYAMYQLEFLKALKEKALSNALNSAIGEIAKKIIDHINAEKGKLNNRVISQKQPLNYPPKSANYAMAVGGGILTVSGFPLLILTILGLFPPFVYAFVGIALLGGAILLATGMTLTCEPPYTIKITNDNPSRLANEHIDALHKAIVPQPEPIIESHPSPLKNANASLTQEDNVQTTEPANTPQTKI